VSPACSIRLVIPEGPGDLSGCIFLISCLSSSGMNRDINKGCVVVVAVEACILGRSEGVCPRPVHFSHRRVRVDVGKGGGPGQIQNSAS